MAREKGKTGKQHSKEWFEALLVALFFATLIRVFIVESYHIPTSSMEKTLLAGDFLFVNKYVYGAKVPFTDARLPGVDSVERGDIVVFKFPKDRSLNYIKRCVALPGDTLEIRDRELIVNGVRQSLPEHAEHVAPIQPEGSADPQIFPAYSGFNKDNYGPLYIPRKGDVLELDRSTLPVYADLIAGEGHTIGRSGETILVDGKPADSYTVSGNYFFVMGDNRDNSLDSRYWGFLSEQDIVGQALLVYWSWSPDIPLSDPMAKLASIRWARTGLMVH